MASHYISLSRGLEGIKIGDFTIGAASTDSNVFEFRILDGVTPKRVEVIKALEAFERYFELAQPSLDGFAAKGFEIGG